jgi:hypothetical protein
METMRRVLPELDALAGQDPIVFDTSNLRTFEPYSATMMMRMQELGVEFRVTDEGMVRQLGESRRASGDETTTVFQLEGLAALDYGGTACTIALASALAPDDEREVRALADRLAAELADGTIEIDESALGDADPIDQLAVARQGDRQAAWLLVLDGALFRWAADAVATRDAGDLRADMERVGRWVITTYGLFADGLTPCPS